MDEFIRKSQGPVHNPILLTKEEIEAYIKALGELIVTEEFRDSLRTHEYGKKFDKAIAEIIYWNRIIDKYL